MLDILRSSRTSDKRTLRQKAQGYEMRIRKMITKAGAAGVTVFDWDDTLFPTVDIFSRQELTEECCEQLQELAIVVEKLLKCCLRVGPVIIVTNSEKGWVECCSTVALYLRELLMRNNTPEDRYTDASSIWKFLAFSLLLSEFKPSQLISIGDSVKERQACLKVTAASTSRCLPKSVKLVSAPTSGTLIRELTLLRRLFEDLFTFNGPVDILFDGEDFQLRTGHNNISL
ncbi:hypothetical protein FOZ60_004059 [Perkinsus olseni]|uniref:Uncharacterized protein n=1 Tax=Perkinsus olseni TaxID=32597 RepID=A0A7J6PH59_PEROL|nr:hypothetical protein FOZ60_004059 [Perkinsus olseni]